MATTAGGVPGASLLALTTCSVKAIAATVMAACAESLVAWRAAGPHMRMKRERKKHGRDGSSRRPSSMRSLMEVSWNTSSQ